MQHPPKNKELPLSVQFAALFFLWTSWFVAGVFVIWRERKLEDEMRYYDWPFLVYQLLFAAIPLALAVAGTVFLLRVTSITQLNSINRLLCYVVGGLTFVAVAVLLSCGIWALSLPWEKIRE